MASSISKFPPSLRIVKSGLIGCAILYFCQPLRADLDSTPKPRKKNTATGSSQPTAIADTATADVPRAGEVVIRLHGIAQGGGQIEFNLQQKPLHGRIISSKPVGLDNLDVVYRHSGDQKSDTDSFIFAVRSSGIGPFSPGLAKIRIIGSPGRLLVPDSLPFPATFVGKTATDSFTILNEGGEILSGKITVPPPWRLEGDATYRLGPGEKRKIVLLFTPITSGNFTGSLAFEGPKPAGVELQGEGLGSFQASPAKLNLTATPDGKRSGIVALQNNTPEPLTIEIESAFQLPKTISLQFGETKEITIEDTGTGPLKKVISFKNRAYVSQIEVSAGK